jgi:hypothetical protein
MEREEGPDKENDFRFYAGMLCLVPCSKLNIEEPRYKKNNYNGEARIDCSRVARVEGISILSSEFFRVSYVLAAKF